MNRIVLVLMLAAGSRALADEQLTKEEAAFCSAYAAPPKGAPESPTAQFRRTSNLSGCLVAFRTKKTQDDRAAVERARNVQIHREEAQREIDRETAAQTQEEREADPKWSRPVLSAAICRATRERRATMATISKEKALAREAGVIDLELMREYQNTLRDDDQTIAESKASLRSMKLSPLACSDKTVSAVVACNEDRDCEDRAITGGVVR